MGKIKGFDGSGFISRNLDTSALLQNLLLAPELLDYSVATSIGEARKARKWAGCKRVVAATSPGEEESQLTVQIAAVNWEAMQFAYGELATNVSVTLPIIYYDTVPSAAAYEITNAKITASTAASVKVHLSEKVGDEQAGYLSVVGAAPSSARQVQVDGANNKLIFHEDLAGAAFSYVVDEALTNVPSIGKAPSPVKIGDMEFLGYACNDEWPNDMLIHIPKIQLSGKPTLNTADDIPTLEVTFEAVVAANEREPIHYYLLNDPS